MLKILVSIRTIWIEIIKEEWLYKNKVNFSLVWTVNGLLNGLLNTGSRFEAGLIHGSILQIMR